MSEIGKFIADAQPFFKKRSSVVSPPVFREHELAMPPSNSNIVQLVPQVDQDRQGRLPLEVGFDFTHGENLRKMSDATTHIAEPHQVRQDRREVDPRDFGIQRGTVYELFRSDDNGTITPIGYDIRVSAYPTVRAEMIGRSRNYARRVLTNLRQLVK